MTQLYKPKNATYLSPDVQNSILKIMGKMIRGTICEQVRQLSISKDVSKEEQLSAVVRYVDKEGIVNERFLTFVQATSLFLVYPVIY